MTRVSAFSSLEIMIAGAFGVVVEVAFVVLFALAQNTAKIQAKEPPVEKETPIEVKPVLDDAPLLKLGGKKVKAKLPDMWVKKTPVKRYKDVSAPTPMAEKTIDKIAKAPTDPEAKPPPPDAAVAKQVDETIPEDEEKKEEDPNLPEEGAADGVKEGTEADPLKAFAVSQYRIKISGWFNSRFKRPTGEIPCEELKKLRSSVSAVIASDRSVSGYTVVSASGNEVFDSRVRQTMDGIVSGHAELPPPPPNYPDILGTTISVAFFVPSCQ